MGQWGNETDAGDSVYDYLQSVKPECWNMNQADADSVLEDVWGDKGISEYDKFNRLGVVTYLLTHELIVPIDKLEQALEYANDELHVDRLKSWGSPKERHEMLIIEMNDIRFAIDNGGKGRKREVQNLGSKVDELIEDTLTPNGPTVIITDCYGIVVNLTGDGGGSITSDLHENPDTCDSEEHREIENYNNAMNGIESVVLGHAIAGIDITTPAYKEGIESAVQGCANSI